MVQGARLSLSGHYRRLLSVDQLQRGIGAEALKHIAKAVFLKDLQKLCLAQVLARGSLSPATSEPSLYGLPQHLQLLPELRSIGGG